MENRKSYRIGELAREFGITTRTIRYYEDQKLLKPRRQGQQRIYSPADRVTLILILRGKRLGLSLTESAELIRMYQPSDNRSQLEALLGRIQQRRQQLKQQLKDIRQLQKELDQAEARCLAALQPGE